MKRVTILLPLTVTICFLLWNAEIMGLMTIQWYRPHYAPRMSTVENVVHYFGSTEYPVAKAIQFSLFALSLWSWRTWYRRESARKYEQGREARQRMREDKNAEQLALKDSRLWPPPPSKH